MDRPAAMSRGPLFCPFCRECFEDTDVCPEHELALVSFDRLPSRGGDVPRDDERVAIHDLRHGRGWLLLAGLLLLGGMAAPLVTTADGVRSTTASGYELASDRALNLWIVPAVAGALLSVLLRRRTPAEMRGSRLAIPLLALMAAGSVGYTLWRIRRATEAYGLELRIEWGLGALALAVALAIAAGVRLGAVRQ